MIDTPCQCDIIFFRLKEALQFKFKLKAFPDSAVLFTQGSVSMKIAVASTIIKTSYTMLT